MNIDKLGFAMNISLEALIAAYNDPEMQRKAHYEPVTPTEEQIAQHARAKAALEEIEENPYIYWPRMDEPLQLEPLATKRIVFDETHDEWLARVQEMLP